MILAITNQKGGTGKSTLATNLAVCFARTGAEVLLVDADPQHSARDWRADRPDAVPLIHVVGLPVDHLHREIPPLAHKFAVLLIDGGGRMTTAARAEEQVRTLAYPAFVTALHDYTAYGEAYALGLGVVEYAPASKAAKELGALFAALQEGLA